MIFSMLTGAALVDYLSPVNTQLQTYPVRCASMRELAVWRCPSHGVSHGRDAARARARVCGGFAHAPSPLLRSQTVVMSGNYAGVSLWGDNADVP